MKKGDGNEMPRKTGRQCDKERDKKRKRTKVSESSIPSISFIFKRT
jgi:hypothetical protein